MTRRADIVARLLCGVDTFKIHANHGRLSIYQARSIVPSELLSKTITSFPFASISTRNRGAALYSHEGDTVLDILAKYGPLIAALLSAIAMGFAAWADRRSTYSSARCGEP